MLALSAAEERPNAAQLIMRLSRHASVAWPLDSPALGCGPEPGQPLRVLSSTRTSQAMVCRQCVTKFPVSRGRWPKLPDLSRFCRGGHRLDPCHAARMSKLVLSLRHRHCPKHRNPVVHPHIEHLLRSLRLGLIPWHVLVHLCSNILQVDVLMGNQHCLSRIDLKGRQVPCRNAQWMKSSDSLPCSRMR